MYLALLILWFTGLHVLHGWVIANTDMNSVLVSNAGKIYQHIVDEVEYYKHAGVTYIKLNNAVHNRRQIFNNYYTGLKSLSKYQYVQQHPSGYIPGYPTIKIIWVRAICCIQLTQLISNSSISLDKSTTNVYVIMIVISYITVFTHRLHLLFSVCTFSVFWNLDMQGKLIISRLLNCVTKQNPRAANFSLLYYLNPNRNEGRGYLVP